MFKLALSPSKTLLEPVFLEINKNEVSSAHKGLIPRVIWMYWDDENVPSVVSLCYEQTKKVCEGYDVLLLNKKLYLSLLLYLSLTLHSQKQLLLTISDLNY